METPDTAPLVINQQQNPTGNNNQLLNHASRSFKSALMQDKEPSKEDIGRRIAEFEERNDDEGMGCDEPPQTKLKIKIEFSKGQLKRIHANQKGSLIMKLSEKKILDSGCSWIKFINSGIWKNLSNPWMLIWVLYNQIRIQIGLLQKLYRRCLDHTRPLPHGS